MTIYDAPKIIHFIYLKGRPFSILYYLAIKTANYYNMSCKIYLYIDNEPDDKTWFNYVKKIPCVTIEQIIPVTKLNGHIVKYKQQQADYLRICKLYERGGVYFDLDIISLQPITDLLSEMKAPTIMGQEREEEFNLCNAVIITIPKSPFIKEWIKMYETTWGNRKKYNWWFGHSTVVPKEIHKLHPELLSIIPNHVFYPFLWTDFSILNEPDNGENYENSTTVHLWETEVEKTELLPQTPFDFLKNTAFNRLFAKFIPQVEMNLFNDLLKEMTTKNIKTQNQFLDIIIKKLTLKQISLMIYEKKDIQLVYEFFIKRYDILIDSISDICNLTNNISEYNPFLRFLYYKDLNFIEPVYLNAFYGNNFSLSLRLNQIASNKNPSDLRVKHNIQFSKDRIESFEGENIFNFEVYPYKYFNDIGFDNIFNYTIKDFVLLTDDKTFEQNLRTNGKQLCLELNTKYCDYELIIFSYNFDGEFDIKPMTDNKGPENNAILVTHHLLYKITHEKNYNLLSEACLVTNKN